MFDTVHDIKVSRHHIVFADFPFVVDEKSFMGVARDNACQNVGQLFIVSKQQLNNARSGERIRPLCIKIDCPVGHLWLDSLANKNITCFKFSQIIHR